MDLLYKEESYRIIGGAMAVWNELGYGFLERIYENSLAHELGLSGFEVRQQVPFSVSYKKRIVGDYAADTVVDGKILLEIKSVECINGKHIAQTLNYLKATGLTLGLVINFGPEGIEHKRLVKTNR